MPKESKIKIDPNNPRYHSDRNKELIQKSLEDNGAGRSILADASGVIIAGNGTYEQAQKLGMDIQVVKTDGTKLVVLQRDDLDTDDPRRKSLVIADNATTDTSEWDLEKLEDEYFEDIDFEEWDIANVGKNEYKGNFGDDGIGDKNQYGVIVICADASEQEKVFNSLSEKGYECKIVVT